MEALAALGVAAAVLQFVDFADRTCKDVQKIINEGDEAIVQQLTFERVIVDLGNFLASFKNRERFSSQFETRENDEVSLSAVSHKTRRFLFHVLFRLWTQL